MIVQCAQKGGKEVASRDQACPTEIVRPGRPLAATRMRCPTACVRRACGAGKTARQRPRWLIATRAEIKRLVEAAPHPGRGRHGAGPEHRSEYRHGPSRHNRDQQHSRAGGPPLHGEPSTGAPPWLDQGRRPVEAPCRPETAFGKRCCGPHSFLSCPHDHHWVK